MRGPQTLLEHEDNWVTDMGRWFPGDRVVLRGRDLHHDLKDVGWTEMLLLVVTGRTFTREQVRLFEGMFTLTVSYADPRLWINRVAALAASSRSTGILGCGAALSVLEAEIYGGGPIIGGMDFLLRAKRRLDEGANLIDLVKTEIAETRGVPGFGRPVTPHLEDERLAPVLSLARELRLADGPYVELVFDVRDVLAELQGTWAFKMTIAALVGALGADQGLSPRELYNLAVPGFSIGYLACYVDAEQKPEGALFPLRCSRIQYEGAAPRAFRASAQR